MSVDLKVLITLADDAESEGLLGYSQALRNAATEIARLHVQNVGADVGSAAARDVLAERRRQVEGEGWTPGHDDEHRKGELACAAACYATELDLWTGHEQADRKGRPTLIGANRVWPWSGWWKPADRRRNLVKSGALILAEIERIDRVAARENVGVNVGSVAAA